MSTAAGTAVEPTNETQEVRAIVRALRERWPEAWITKVHGSIYQRVGLPDLLVCVHGLLIGLEVKHQRPSESSAHARGRATLVQEAELARIRNAGGHAAVILNPAEAIMAVEFCLVRACDAGHTA